MNRYAMVSAAAVIISGCTTTWSDSDPVRYSEPPEPRNDCETAFLDELTADIGIAISPPPSPQTDAVIKVMDECTAIELLAADEYLAYSVGNPMGRLRHHRLFSGPGRAAQLERLCADDPYHSTVACRTRQGGGA